MSNSELPGLSNSSRKPYAVPYTFVVEGSKFAQPWPILQIPICTATYTPQFGGPYHWSINCVGGLGTSQILSADSKQEGRTILNPGYPSDGKPEKHPRQGSDVRSIQEGNGRFCMAVKHFAYTFDSSLFLDRLAELYRQSGQESIDHLLSAAERVLTVPSSDMIEALVGSTLRPRRLDATGQVGIFPATQCWCYSRTNSFPPCRSGGNHRLVS